MTSARSILWVEASPKGALSTSTACARAFLDVVTDVEPSIAVTHIDVWDDDLPEFGRDAAIAKFAPLFGEQRTEEQERIWTDVLAYIADVRAHDAVVVSCPMWNWNVPYRMKQWIDLIVQPFVSFTLDESGRHVGALGVDRHAQLILTRSSAYDGRSPEMVDHQRPYLEYLFGDMLGYTLAESIVVEPTTAFKAAKRAAIVSDACARSREAGRAFAARLLAPGPDAAVD